MSSKPNILDASLDKVPPPVSQSAFAYLFSEMVQYFQERVLRTDDLEDKLDEAGYSVGIKIVELFSIREKNYKRFTTISQLLNFLTTIVWKQLFGKTIDTVERSNDNDLEYMIYETDPITNTFISVPEDIGDVNCAAFIAGIIRGVANQASLPAKVTTHYVEYDGILKTVYLMKFDKSCTDRE